MLVETGSKRHAASEARQTDSQGRCTQSMPDAKYVHLFLQEQGW